MTATAVTQTRAIRKAGISTAGTVALYGGAFFAPQIGTAGSAALAASWTFYGALGELRGTFGVHVAKIAAEFRLDVEDRLGLHPARQIGRRHW